MVVFTGIKRGVHHIHQDRMNAALLPQPDPPSLFHQLGCIQGTTSEPLWRNSIISLPCLENGSPLWRLPFAIKRTILIGGTVGHFRGVFDSCLKLETSPRQTLNANWEEEKKRRLVVDFEVYPECAQPRTAKIFFVKKCRNGKYCSTTKYTVYTLIFSSPLFWSV